MNMKLNVTKENYILISIVNPDEKSVIYSQCKDVNDETLRKKALEHEKEYPAENALTIGTV